MIKLIYLLWPEEPMAPALPIASNPLATRADVQEAVRQLCDDRDLALIVDDVQAVMGRTGTWFSWQQLGFEPDQLPNGLTLTLGAGSATLPQMAQGYAVLANGGHLMISESGGELEFTIEEKEYAH